jgi:hypothetical protein
MTLPDAPWIREAVAFGLPDNDMNKYELEEFNERLHECSQSLKVALNHLKDVREWLEDAQDAVDSDNTQPEYKEIDAILDLVEDLETEIKSTKGRLGER